MPSHSRRMNMKELQWIFWMNGLVHCHAEDPWRKKLSFNANAKVFPQTFYNLCLENLVHSALWYKFSLNNPLKIENMVIIGLLLWAFFGRDDLVMCLLHFGFLNSGCFWTPVIYLVWSLEPRNQVKLSNDPNISWLVHRWLFIQE